ncbi:hypothetical protein CcrC1_gp443 [Caulobacter phage C1]|nr:hypothetical protein CcrC1_gp443 [Caulobacter phage C1]UTU08672.1 hypothetical protein CcrC2_gp444 [Caulobacter phage C2]UTU09185.1 hypothetical protein CcrJ4_gp438 [Caulobacter phage J4]UTU09750.1 hypothetical protein CcrBL47_gp466 [Caulobacter phage BL47]UTU10304.1 hypothetical protein CcrRB23_gp442 [Caulobacter phage RB23]WGN97338.1 hypothetical protein [Bertelyvirus sp.]
MRRRAHEVLAMLIAAPPDENDILCDRGTCYAGNVRIARATVDELLCHLAITRDGEEIGDRYVVNSTGRAIHRRPALAPEIMKVMGQQLPFRIDADDQIKILEDL